jgi:hypothetical protein
VIYPLVGIKLTNELILNKIFVEPRRGSTTIDNGKSKKRTTAWFNSIICGYRVCVKYFDIKRTPAEFDNSSLG